MSSTKITEFDLDPNMGLAKESTLNEIKTSVAKESSVQQVLMSAAREDSVQEIKSLIENAEPTGGYDIPHGSVTFETAGTHTWTCPENVYEVIAFIAGGTGGGGGGASTGWSSDRCGGGGASGTVWVGIIPVVPGITYTLTVGSGGSGGAKGGTSDSSVGGNGTSGGNSSFESLVIVGGGGGGKGSGKGTGGEGGSVNQTYTITHVVKTINMPTGATGGAGTSSAAGVGATFTTGEPYIGFTTTKGGNGGALESKGASGNAGKILLQW